MEAISILFAFPQGNLQLNSNWQIQSDFMSVDESADFLDVLDSHWLNEKQNIKLTQELPFRGGWFKFLAYELANQIEPILCHPRTPWAKGLRCPDEEAEKRSAREKGRQGSQPISSNLSPAKFTLHSSCLSL